jgi:hypothetical protein
VDNPPKRRGESDSRQIDEWIIELDDWRGRTFKKLRELVKQADPGIEEELKWKRPINPMGSPVYSRNGIICTGAVLKNSVRLTFLKGASLKDPSGLFNFGLDSNVRRAIDVHEGDKINELALMDLVRAAAALNLKSGKRV